MPPNLEQWSPECKRQIGKDASWEDVGFRGSQQLGRIQARLTYRLYPCLRSGEASPAAGSPEALALLANGAPCPSTDYQPSLAHRAHFTHCLQEPPPGNLYLQGWQTAISSITGWLRETEPIKWVLESPGVSTSVLSKGEKERKKENACNVECTARLGEKKKSAHAMQKHTAFQKMPEPTGTGRGTDNWKVTRNLQKYSNGGPFLGVRLSGLQPFAVISQKDWMTFS